MKHRRFRSGCWRAHWYGMEGNGLLRTATHVQFTARRRGCWDKNRNGYIVSEKPNAEERLQP